MFGDTVFVTGPTDISPPSECHQHMVQISISALFLIHTLLLASDGSSASTQVNIDELGQQLVNMTQSLEFVQSEVTEQCKTRQTMLLQLWLKRRSWLGME